jgi:hypothetical protein
VQTYHFQQAQAHMRTDHPSNPLHVSQLHESPSFTHPPASRFHHGGTRIKISGISVSVGISFIGVHYPNFGGVGAT